ncbi:MAG: fused MFS/spermidine synthase [Acidimicrobiia bacterium]|nr:fused MFS/spermidine synthase [Acidimicrobiia bacterium]
MRVHVFSEQLGTGDNARMSSRIAGALVFFTSAVVLVLEILAGRLLAPYAGVTLETFTAIIGVVLAGIAFGTWFGGRYADLVASPATLVGPVLVLGGALAASTVPLARVLGPSLGTAGITGLIALTAIAILPATAILSATPPIIVKVILEDLGTTGATVGRISALGTAGALVGTFTSGFVLVATLPTSVTILTVALVTAAVGLWLWARHRPQRNVLGVVAVIGLAAGSVLTASVSSPCDVETAYFCASEVPVADNPNASILLLDTLTHAYVNKTDPTDLRFSSIRMFASAIEAMTDGPIDVLHVGGGGFSLPNWVSATRPASTNVVLELDGALVEFVEERFEPAPVEETIVGDARVSVTQVGNDFDVVVGDAFGGLAVPWHLTTAEFLAEVSGVLGDEGFYIMNLIDHGDLAFLRAELATAATVFPHVALATLPERLEVGGNFMLVAAKRPIPGDDIIGAAAALDLGIVVLTGDALDAFVDGAQILTDDFAPVDQLLEASSG